MATEIFKGVIRMHEKVKRFLAITFGVIGGVAILSAILYSYKDLPVPSAADSDPTPVIQAMIHADDPVMLYQTVGIKECGGNTLYKIETTRAVLLSDDDFRKVTPILKRHFKETIAAALYTNVPEAVMGVHGQPALIPLSKKDDTYCALGFAVSYSEQIFFDLEAKYQPLVKEQE